MANTLTGTLTDATGAVFDATMTLTPHPVVVAPPPPVVASPDGTIVTAPSTAALTFPSGNQYTITPGAQRAHRAPLPARKARLPAHSSGRAPSPRP